MFFKAFGRQIEFLDIFCTFSKIPLAEGAGLAAKGGGPVVKGGKGGGLAMKGGNRRGGQWWSSGEGWQPAGVGGGPTTAGSGLAMAEGNRRWVVVGDNRGNLVFS